VKSVSIAVDSGCDLADFAACLRDLSGLRLESGAAKIKRVNREVRGEKAAEFAKVKKIVM
jgi:hypothetical protein